MQNNAETFGDLLTKAQTRFAENNIDNAGLDARILLEEASGLGHAELISKASEPVPARISKTFESHIERRLAGEPVHRVLGWREFFGRAFRLNSETLVPRDDTGALVEAALEAVGPSQKGARILDIGTGSGIIAITLACEIEGSELVATDISQAALDMAAANAGLHEVQDKITFLQSDLYDAVDGCFDLIVSNPPYIRSDDISELAVEVREHDPLVALDGGDDGLRFYRTIFSQGDEYLEAGGTLIVEIGYDQAEAIIEIALAAGFGDVEARKDLSGNPRIVIAAR